MNLREQNAKVKCVTNVKLTLEHSVQGLCNTTDQINTTSILIIQVSHMLSLKWSR